MENNEIKVLKVVENRTTYEIDGKIYVEFSYEDNVKSSILDYEDGYDKFFDVTNYMKDQLGMTLVDSKGVTDLINEFEKSNFNVSLIYYSYEDGMLGLKSTCKDEQQIAQFRLLVHRIKSHLIGKNKILENNEKKY